MLKDAKQSLVAMSFATLSQAGPVAYVREAWDFVHSLEDASCIAGSAQAYASD